MKPKIFGPIRLLTEPDWREKIKEEIKMAIDKEKCLEILDRALTPPMSEKDDFREKAQLIGMILNRIKPIPEDAPQDIKEVIDLERQLLVLRVGWGNMPIGELKKLVKMNDKLFH